MQWKGAGVNMALGLTLPHDRQHGDHLEPYNVTGNIQSAFSRSSRGCLPGVYRCVCGGGGCRAIKGNPNP